MDFPLAPFLFTEGSRMSRTGSQMRPVPPDPSLTWVSEQTPMGVIHLGHGCHVPGTCQVFQECRVPCGMPCHPPPHMGLSGKVPSARLRGDQFL